MLLKEIIINLSQQKVTELQRSFLLAIKKLQESFSVCTMKLLNKFLSIAGWFVLFIK